MGSSSTRGLTSLLVVVLYIFTSLTLKLKAQYHLPITKNEPTKQFYTTFNIGSAAKSPVNLILDLETNLSWLNCRNIKSSSTFRHVGCNTTLCKSLSNGHCKANTCYNRQPNPLNPFPTQIIAPLGQDRVSFPTTDGSKFLPQVSVRNFTFLCASQKDLQGASPPAIGVLGLSPEAWSFPNQVTSAFGVIPKFALCLPSSNGTGHFYIGRRPYSIPQFNDRLPVQMTLTPFKITESGKFIISVYAVYVDGTLLQLDPDLLVIGAKLSTVVPYTRLRSDIYTALAKSFTEKAKALEISKAWPVAPFKDCFVADPVGREGTGPKWPVIEFGLPGRAGEMKWGFHGASTLVKVKESVMCLAFIDGGERPRDIMVLGTHQLQDYIVEFDFSRTELAYSDSLLLHNTSCSAWPSQK